MKIYRSIQAFQEVHIPNPVITFGSFDGVHLGHSFIFEKMSEYAHSINGETVVTTFHPHPRKVIYPDDRSMKMLTPIEEKIDLLKKQNIDHLVIIPFSIEFSQMSPNEYIESFIIRYFKPHTVMIGYDHRFGLNRSGDINSLLPYQEKGDFIVTKLPQKKIDNLKISSTLIRRALEGNQVEQANKMLGYPYTLKGQVVHGEKMGEKLGFRTANISVEEDEKLIPGNGIYAVTAFVQQQLYQGMLYIGTKSTLPSGGDVSIEVHLFDFNKDIYHEEIAIGLVAFVRKDATFDSLEELSENIQADQEKTLKLLDGEKANIQS
ncbi:MAG TPA: bifunctional riboflavin kinase/FAD synthetase [Membranihabitans sp.]|nr:bifunctional riboflavin kinase/FAD synthetase [Membranihabitans sp.]